MADFDPPFASTGPTRYPDATEKAVGFPCGPLDLNLFNGLFKRLESELNNVIKDAGIVPSDASFNQVSQAIQSLINTAIQNPLDHNHDELYYRKSAVDALIAGIASWDGNWLYESSPQSVVAGSSLTLNHGLGRQPYKAEVRLLCIVSEGGYSVGDEVENNFYVSSYGMGPTICYDFNNTTTIRVVSGSQTIGLPNKNNGGWFYINSNNWRYIVRAR